jgi:hypothetical protein
VDSVPIAVANLKIKVLVNAVIFILCDAANYSHPDSDDEPVKAGHVAVLLEGDSCGVHGMKGDGMRWDEDCQVSAKDF